MFVFEIFGQQQLLPDYFESFFLFFHERLISLVEWLNFSDRTNVGERFLSPFFYPLLFNNA